METKYNIGDEVYIKVKVDSIKITGCYTKYTVFLPSMFINNGRGEICEEQLYTFAKEEEQNDKAEI